MKRVVSIVMFLVVALAITPGELFHDHDAHHHEHGDEHHDDKPADDCFICDFELVPAVLADVTIEFSNPILSTELTLQPERSRALVWVPIEDGRGPPRV